MIPDEGQLQRYLDDERSLRDEHWHPGKGQTAVDIGCAFGSYALQALAYGASVIAVDSDAAALAGFVSLCQRDGYTKYRAVNAGVGAPYPPELLGAIPDYMRPYPPTWMSLDALVGKRRCDWLKIDVEGGELGVLESGLRTLARCHPRLLIEDHTDVYPWVAKSRSVERIERLLRTLKYTWDKVPYLGLDGPRPYWITH